MIRPLILEDERVFALKEQWKRNANCHGEKKLFQETTHLGAFEEVPQDLHDAVGQAKKTCISCVVRSTCLSQAMEEEKYLGAMERYGIRGAWLAQDRLLEAANNPICARCEERPVAEWDAVTKIRTLCRVCQVEVYNNPEQKYFAEMC